MAHVNHLRSSMDLEEFRKSKAFKVESGRILAAVKACRGVAGVTALPEFALKPLAAAMVRGGSLELHYVVIVAFGE